MNKYWKCENDFNLDTPLTSTKIMRVPPEFFFWSCWCWRGCDDAPYSLWSWWWLWWYDDDYDGDDDYDDDVAEVVMMHHVASLVSVLLVSVLVISISTVSASPIEEDYHMVKQKTLFLLFLLFFSTMWNKLPNVSR